jgi:hypothetical protein
MTPSYRLKARSVNPFADERDRPRDPAVLRGTKELGSALIQQGALPWESRGASLVLKRFLTVVLVAAASACAGPVRGYVPSGTSALSAAREAAATLTVQLRIKNTSATALRQHVVSSHCLVKLPAETEIPVGTSIESVEVETTGPCRSIANFTAIYRAGTGSSANRLAELYYTHFGPTSPHGKPSDVLSGRGYNGLCATALNRTRAFTVFEGQPPTKGCFTEKSPLATAPLTSRTFTLTVENATGVNLSGLAISSFCMARTPGGSLPAGTTKTETIETFGKSAICNYAADFTAYYWESGAPQKSLAALEWIFEGPSTTKVDARGYEGYCAVKVSATHVKFYKATGTTC